jgi:hypothetical protein
MNKALAIRLASKLWSDNVLFSSDLKGGFCSGGDSRWDLLTLIYMDSIKMAIAKFGYY